MISWIPKLLAFYAFFILALMIGFGFWWGLGVIAVSCLPAALLTGAFFKETAILIIAIWVSLYFFTSSEFFISCVICIPLPVVTIGDSILSTWADIRDYRKND